MVDLSPHYGGRYLVARDGLPAVHDGATAGLDWIPSEFSVVSPGTEQWQLSQSRDRRTTLPLGYIAGARLATGAVVVAPAPHGATFSPLMPGSMTVSAPLHRIAVGRFQLVTAASLQAVGQAFRSDVPTLLVGSGAVAIGAALELGRLGFADVRLVSTSASRLNRNLPSLPWLTSALPNEARPSPQVIDCVGTITSLTLTQRLCSAQGVIGLLGSPRDAGGLSLYGVHRNGLNVVGLHELLLEDLARGQLLKTILQWLATLDDSVPLGDLVRTHSGVTAPHVYDGLAAHRFTEPIQVFDWSTP